MSDKYVVKSGDSLSRIGQERWKEIYKANRSEIGDDPNVIKPGQELTLPAEVSEVPETPEVLETPAAPVNDEYVEIDPEICMLQSCEIETCDVADTFHMPAYWRLSFDIEANSADNIALDYLVPTGISESTEQLFEVANESATATAAINTLKDRAERGELSVKELRAAADHDEEKVRKIAAANPATPTDVLFKLANDSVIGLYFSPAIAAIKTLEDRAERGELSVKELRAAADHDEEKVRKIALTHIATR